MPILSVFRSMWASVSTIFNIYINEMFKESAFYFMLFIKCKAVLLHVHRAFKTGAVVCYEV